MQLWFPLHEAFADVSRFIKRLFFKLTLICNLSLAPAQTKLWVPHRCSASTIALLLPWQQRVRQPGLPPPSVSSILGVYFWVTAERLNVFALLAPAAPLKSKLEIRIRTTDSWRPKPGLKFKSVVKGLIHLSKPWYLFVIFFLAFAAKTESWKNIYFARLSAKRQNRAGNFAEGIFVDMFRHALTGSNAIISYFKSFSECARKKAVEINNF